jgi:sodium/potassium/calcium exchanger 6
LGKVASVFAAPAVLALTLTLPVMVTPYENSHTHEEKIQGSEGRLIDFEEEGIERALIAEEEVQEDMHEMKFNKWLMAAQCALGPLFCVGVLFGEFVHSTCNLPSRLFLRIRSWN